MIDSERLAKYLAGEARPEEIAEVQAWLKADAANEAAMRKLELAMRPDRSKERDFSASLEEDWLSLQNKLNPQAQVVPLEAKSPAWPWMKIAASFLLLAVAGLGLWLGTGKQLPWQQHQQFVASDSLMYLELADGSRVWLNRNAQLEVYPDFGQEDRKVKLKGEAYFEVAKNADKPFLIYTGETTTQVLGTAFNLRQEPQGSVNLSVTEGKVSFDAQTGSPLYLTPGESGFYNTSTGMLSESTSQDPNFLAWKTGLIRFHARPLGEVVQFLSSHYNTPIALKEAALAQHTITTVLDRLSLEEALQVISITLDLPFKKNDATIYFYQKE